MKAGDITPGDIHHVYCTETYPPKNKFHVFFEDGYFFLINTKYWDISVEIKECDYPFLNHDSYIGLRLFKYDPDKELSSGRKGALNKNTIDELIRQIPDEITLTQEQAELLLAML